MRSLPDWRRIALHALLGLGIGAVPVFGQGEAESLSASFRKASKRVLPAVVGVRPVEPPIGGRFRMPPGLRAEFMPPRESGGSGVVINAEKGHVLTNDHVVQGAREVEVTLPDGRTRQASKVKRDPKSDLALLTIDPEGLTQAGWGDSEALETGDWVLAVGHPFGLSNTVTAGIVSGKGRGIGLAMYEDLLQTDAAINPGNSGGPLVNLKGEVVGINSAIKTLGGGYEGIGFAVPSSRARRVAADLAEHGRVRRAYLGLRIGQVDPTTAERLKQPGAVVVNEVTPETPAAKAHVYRGDVILTINGKTVEGPGGLQAVVETALVGEPLKLGIDRDGEKREIEVRPQEQPDRFGLPEEDPGPVPRFRRPPPVPRPPTPPDQPALESLKIVPPPALDELPELPKLPTLPTIPDLTFGGASFSIKGIGMKMEEPSTELVELYGLKEPVKGFVITSIEADSPAHLAGLKRGMVITEVGGKRIRSSQDIFQAAYEQVRKDDKLPVRVLKGAKVETHEIVVPPELRPQPEDAKGDPGGGS